MPRLIWHPLVWYRCSIVLQIVYLPEIVIVACLKCQLKPCGRYVFNVKAASKSRYNFAMNSLLMLNVNARYSTKLCAVGRGVGWKMHLQWVNFNCASGKDWNFTWCIDELGTLFFALLAQKGYSKTSLMLINHTKKNTEWFLFQLHATFWQSFKNRCFLNLSWFVYGKDCLYQCSTNVRTNLSAVFYALSIMPFFMSCSLLPLSFVSLHSFVLFPTPKDCWIQSTVRGN